MRRARSHLTKSGRHDLVSCKLIAARDGSGHGAEYPPPGEV